MPVQRTGGNDRGRLLEELTQILVKEKVENKSEECVQRIRLIIIETMLDRLRAKESNSGWAGPEIIPLELTIVTVEFVIVEAVDLADK